MRRIVLRNMSSILVTIFISWFPQMFFSPLEQFSIIKIIPISIFGLDFSFANSSLFAMLFCLLTAGGLFCFSTLIIHKTGSKSHGGEFITIAHRVMGINNYTISGLSLLHRLRFYVNGVMVSEISVPHFNDFTVDEIVTQFLSIIKAEKRTYHVFPPERNVQIHFSAECDNKHTNDIASVHHQLFYYLLINHKLISPMILGSHLKITMHPESFRDIF
jgi:hypothetical protein